MNPKRKLAAIVFADIAGYTDKASRDEKAALQVRERVEKILKSGAITRHGRVVKTLGDGAMMEFPSAVEAVGCALDIQEQMQHLNEELQLAEPVRVRIGVHVGDVVEEDDDLYGNAVNIASRVHSLAKPGGICITREVYVQIRPILKLQCDPVEGASSGRLPEPIEVFRIVGEERPEIAVPPKPGRTAARLLGVMGALAFAAIAVVAYTALAPKSPAEAPLAGHSPRPVARLLLPDWVTPGEEFELDAGDRAGNLTVFFGNREAETRIREGKLAVRVPLDLPTRQTTISVYEKQSSSPLLSQTTQIIRGRTVAMRGTEDTLSADLPAPQVSAEATPVGSKPDPASTRAEPEPQQAKPTEKPKQRPTQSAAPKEKPAQKPNAEEPIVRVVKVQPPKLEGYESLVDTIVEDKPVKAKPPLRFVRMHDPALKKAMQAVTRAAGQEKKEAIKLLEEAKATLKDSKDPHRPEVISLIKSTEAMISEAPPGAHGGHPDAKWAEAFAYSVNNGTHNLPGLAMINRLIREGKHEEARRAMEVLRKRANLNTVEVKVLGRLERRINRSRPGPGQRVWINAPRPPGPAPDAAPGPAQQGGF